jgi:hypothetical protein
LPYLVVARLTPPLSLTSFTSTSSFVLKLLKNVLLTFNITIRVDLDVFKAFLGAFFLAFLAVAIALHAFIASILAYTLASRAT